MPNSCRRNTKRLIDAIVCERNPGLFAGKRNEAR